MKKIIVLLLIVVSSLNVLAQNFVGKHKLQIKKEMKENYQDFFFSKEVMSKNSFIKYEDTDGYQTYLFVLDDDGYCKYHMLMCDYSLLKSTIEELNSTYEYKNNLIWHDYITGNKNFVITIKKEEWYFSVITKKLEEKE